MKTFIIICVSFVLVALTNSYWYLQYEEMSARLRYQLNQMRDAIDDQSMIIQTQEIELAKLKENNVLHLTVTAYTPRVTETDGTPQFTAIMSPSRPGYSAAVSRDLIHYLGKKIYVPGYGVFRIEDLMNKRYHNRIDLMFGDVQVARKFGKKKLKIIVLG